MSLKDITKLLSLAQTRHNYAVASCNRMLSEKELRKVELTRRAIHAICSGYPKTIAEVQTSGDPRGYTTKLKLKSGISNTMDNMFGIPVKV
jgi:hypothetical protein